MMQNWFVSKIRYEKTMENGMVKKVTEPYLIDAQSFTEAEARTIEKLQPFMSGEFLISDISRAKYTEIVTANQGINLIDAEAKKILGENSRATSDADKWYDCKLSFISLNETTGAEKKTACFMLVNASSLDAANNTLVEHMRGTMADYVIDKIAETPIVDVFPYDGADNSEK